MQENWNSNRFSSDEEEGEEEEEEDQDENQDEEGKKKSESEKAAKYMKLMENRNWRLIRHEREQFVKLKSVNKVAVSKRA